VAPFWQIFHLHHFSAGPHGAAGGLRKRSSGLEFAGGNDHPFQCKGCGEFKHCSDRQRHRIYTESALTVADAGVIFRSQRTLRVHPGIDFRGEFHELSDGIRGVRPQQVPGPATYHAPPTEGVYHVQFIATQFSTFDHVSATTTAAMTVTP
jgi:hypothetical protein